MSNTADLKPSHLESSPGDYNMPAVSEAPAIIPDTDKIASFALELQGKYHDLSIIGSGSQATMVKAKDNNNLPVAIKIFDLSTSDGWDDADLFEREIAVLKNLHVKGVPAYIETIKSENRIYLVEEYIDALSLEKQLDNGRKFTLEESLIIFERTAEILKDLGACIPPVVHRDIKPDNLLVDKDLNVYLIDFGVVANKASTFSMTFAGTAGYVAPEQLYGKATAASDIFSLGATMLHLISGISPCDMQLDGIEPDVDRYLPQKTPSWLADLLKRMMSADPAERPQTGAELVQLVKQGQEGKAALSGAPKSFLHSLLAQTVFVPFLTLSSLVIILGLFVIPTLTPDIDNSSSYFYIIFFCLAIFAIPCILTFIRHKKRYSLLQNKEFAELISSISEADLNNEASQITNKVKLGNPHAMVKLGGMYQDGNGVARNYENAFKLFLNAAAQGLAEGMTKLGYCYLNGTGTAVNPQKAFRCFVKAADQGDTTAQLELGDMYCEGKGVPKNLDEAIFWYKKAQNTNPVTALTSLGNIYYNELKDYDQAFIYYSKSVDKGGVAAMTNLGLCYEYGKGVAQDDAQAFKYYKMASEHNDYLASYYLGMMYKDGKVESKNLIKAFNLIQDAAIHDITIAESTLGYCYEYGLGTTKDYDLALHWYTKSAEHNDAYGQCNLGLMYYYGRGTDVDYDQAIKWFRKAADQGNATAENMLGMMYKNGNGIKNDHVMARKYFQRAADKDNSDACVNLGLAYQNGHGGEKNIYMAKKLFQKAADLGNTKAKNLLNNLK